MRPADLERTLARLSHNLDAVRALASGATAEQALWRPAPDAWCLVEVVNHLVDEEREDFRLRLDLTLHSPDEPFPPIDPAGWVVERDYASRDLAASIGRFTTERNRSLSWLTQLGDVDWHTSRRLPSGDVIRAGDLLASWTAHDHLHLRQLNELQHAHLACGSEPFDVAYAGAW